MLTAIILKLPPFTNFDIVSPSSKSCPLRQKYELFYLSGKITILKRNKLRNYVSFNPH